ncbi:hypothetical protein FOJ82_04890 [Tessaracoccus rhinocerotis]|uniref:Uncharacterized protein n=1 Tax=Tessaracoccus rhinocerotis TaxID=1689449 RepID=A0A553K665_9ACTN|nr:hypothetical protein [Tessaracoccus rhinocerotis]TRY20200.1 hypothetical protein FOJ82_04890 [Tessaracoccus rhinocerotis]
MNQRPQLPPELDEVLEAKLRRASRATRDGDHAAALVLGEEIWDALPEPKLGWDYYPEILSQKMCDAAIEAGQLDRAAVWLERTTEAYGADNASAAPIIGFKKAKLYYRSGQLDLAYAYFDANYTADGKRRFKGEPEEYWQFYEAARASGGVAAQDEAVTAVGTAGSPVPADGAGSPSGGELPDEIHAEVTRLFEEGANFEDLNAPDAAVECHTRALELLPTPRTQWEAATLLYTALADALGALDRWADAYEALQLALRSPGGRENGYVWLRLGDAHRAEGRDPQALEAYTSAFMLEGADLFEDSPEELAWLQREGIS